MRSRAALQPGETASATSVWIGFGVVLFVITAFSISILVAVGTPAPSPPTPVPAPPTPSPPVMLQHNAAAEPVVVASLPPPSNNIHHKLQTEKIYFFYDSDIDTSGSISYNGATTPLVHLYNRVRHEASPDPTAGERHTVNVVMLVAPPHPMAFPPNLSLTATAFGEEASLFYGSSTAVDQATLRHIGCLAPNCNIHVLAGKLTAPQKEGSYRLGWTDAAQKRHSSTPDVELGPREAILDVTCDDQIFCNGPEYFLKGRCVAMASNPCHFHAIDACLQHECLEETKLCGRESLATLAGVDCDACGPVCQPKCDKGQKCGSGGCPICKPGQTIDCAPANFCGGCDEANGEICLEGSCAILVASETPGSCNNPYPLMKSFDPQGGTGDATYYTFVAGNDPAAVDPNGYIVPAGGALFRIEVPTDAYMEDNTTPNCGAPGVQEHVFKFTIDLPAGSEGQGMEVMVVSGDYDLSAPDSNSRFVSVNAGLDTLLAIHDGDCKPLTTGGAAYSTCSDDATPMGSLLSHLYTRLDAGDFTLISTYFGAQSGGPYVLLVKFTSALETCFPQCDAKFCGNDECSMLVDGVRVDTRCGAEQFFEMDECNVGTGCIGGRCSNCTESFTTSPFYESSCGPNGQCGYDQCNLACNKKEETRGEPACEKGIKACNEETHQCVPVGVCDNFSPECQGEKKGQAEAKFCGSDCQRYRTYDTLPDLTPDTQEEIASSIIFNRRTFSALSCGVEEGCVGPVSQAELDSGNFTRTLMRFDTNVVNLGDSFKPPAIDRSPQIYEYSRCHGHNHFRGFARFDLFRLDDVTTVQELDRVVTGGKLAYCMEDSIPYFANPRTPCNGESVCDDQGIFTGWIDRYPGDLDCQWLVMDQFYAQRPAGGWFVYQVCTNYGRAFQEKTFSNNCRAFPIYVIPQSEIPQGGLVSYATSMSQNPGRCASLPAELPAGVEWPSVCP